MDILSALDYKNKDSSKRSSIDVAILAKKAQINAEIAHFCFGENFDNACIELIYLQNQKTKKHLLSNNIRLEFFE